MSRSKAASARSRTPTRCSPTERRGDRDGAGIVAGADRQAAGARRRPGDERRLALRPRAGRARDQAGARRPDRGDLPAARLPHHAAALRRLRADRHRRHGYPPAHLGDLQGSAGRPGARARPSTTPTACSITRWPSGDVAEPRAGDAGRRRRHAARHRSARRRRADRSRRRGRTRRAGRRPHPRAAVVSRPTATCGCRTWRAATKASCWRSATRPSAATAATIPSPARSASARSRSSSSPRRSASPCRSARSR